MQHGVEENLTRTEIRQLDNVYPGASIKTIIHWFCCLFEVLIDNNKTLFTTQFASIPTTTHHFYHYDSIYIFKSQFYNNFRDNINTFFLFVHLFLNGSFKNNYIRSTLCMNDWEVYKRSGKDVENTNPAL